MYMYDCILLLDCSINSLYLVLCNNIYILWFGTVTLPVFVGTLMVVYMYAYSVCIYIY